MHAAPELPEIVAHRGNAAEFPENTLQSLGSAVELGIRYVEFDVQLTADHVPVLMHDSNLARVGGRPECVHDLTWAELAELPVGEVERLGPSHALTYPPSLAQTVEALGSWDGVTAFVEIKRASLRRFGRETVLRSVAQVLAPVLDRCVFISFDWPSVKILRLMTGARIGWVLSRYDDDARRQAEDLEPQFLFNDVERMPSGPEPLWRGPWDWAIYEVRDLQTAETCRERGARFVETMTVRDLLRAYAESRRR